MELFFYLTFPFIAAVVAPFRSRWLGPALIIGGLLIPSVAALYYEFKPELAALASSNPDSSHRWLDRSPLVRLGEFIAGIGSLVLVARYNPWRNRGVWAGVLLLATTAAVLTMGFQEKSPLIRVMPYAAIFVIVVVALARLEQLGAGIRWRFPILLGEASFAFYLIHQYYFKLVLQPPLVEAFGLQVAQATVMVAAVSASIALHLFIEVQARTLMLRVLRIASTMPKARTAQEPASK
ncbi:acyltransferase family protein [Stenotrophomonas maltophilia]|uniref:acyltransferase family protein n=1 Tax=Stenotrophomonas maltophilia TaxID=40324 RepID=UPI0039F6A9E3